MDEAKIGGHQFKSVTFSSPEEAERDAQQSTSIVYSYLRLMGIDSALYDAINRVPNSQIVYFDHSDLRKWNFISDGNETADGHGCGSKRFNAKNIPEGWQIQLGLFTERQSEEARRTIWEKTGQKWPIAGDYISCADGRYYAVRLVGIPDEETARRTCEDLKGHNVLDCFVVTDGLE